jgi:predicted metal-dependent phosphoesterase TrpH
MIDLHTHTTHSDGTGTPAELIRLAVEAGLEALAITDHDTLSGYDEAVPEAGRTGLHLVCALELSTRVGAEPDPRRRLVHLLCYFFTPPGAVFREWLAGLLAARRERNAAIAARLTEMGMPVTLAEAEALGRVVTGRPHFARVLTAKGFVATPREAFDRFLREGGPAYVERRDPSPQEGIARVRAAGGLVALAHPVRLARDERQLSALVRQLVNFGLDAIEVIHPDHGRAEQTRFSALAAEYGLALSGGSDHHGALTPRARLGGVPLAFFEGLRRRALDR